MRRILAAVAFAFLSGCVSYGATNPGVGVGGLDFDKTLSYELLGDTQGQACQAKLFGFILLEGENKAGMVTGSGGGQGNAGLLASLLARGPSGAAGAATYNAIEAFKGADFILPLRSKSDKKDYVVYNRECVTVTGKAIKVKGIGESRFKGRD